ncbi:MAG: YkgJ family cysteine cluster protein [Alphaproteobacteria bacterium]|nr:YkgJ family cysteine cluster protein [Alphaproteobacteria bacterium]
MRHVNPTEDDPTAAFLRRLHQLSAEMAQRTIGQSRTPDGLLALAEGMAELADVATARLTVVLPPERHSACGRGCAHCCKHGGVMVDPVSVLALTLTLTGQYDPVDLAGIMLRLSASAAGACALVDAHDSCLAYVARPLTCRVVNSYDDETCRQFGPPTVAQVAGGEGVALGYPVPLAIAAAIVAGVAQGLATCGILCAPVELNAALRVALSEPDVLERWLAGEDVFAGLVPLAPDVPSA